VATLLALHGYTMNATVFRAGLTELEQALAPEFRLVCPDAPFTCSEASVDRLYANSSGARLPAPYRTWWDASDDGQVYRGWEESREFLRGLIEAHAPVGVLGFSQGGMVAATLAGLAYRQELAGLGYVILVGAATPRARDLQPLFATPIAIPSLHVWGERDRRAVPHSQALVEHFAALDREVAIWPGGHVVPRRGPAFSAMVDFARRHG
jgi:pimeloyl-ACP methyl ester carboxylesterase